MHSRTTSAPCPQCGGPLEFHLKHSVQTVCLYCGALVVRQGESLESFGKCADVLDTASPLQLGTRGLFHSRSFEIVGRRQVTWSGGFWEEWYCHFFQGKDAWLADAQGGFAFLHKVDFPLPQTSLSAMPQPGFSFTCQSKYFQVIDVKKAFVSAIEGEMPEMTNLGKTYISIDCASAGSHLCTLDFSPDRPPACYFGEWILPHLVQWQYTKEMWNGWG
jgi:hypothetical protein